MPDTFSFGSSREAVDVLGINDIPGLLPAPPSAPPAPLEQPAYQAVLHKGKAYLSTGTVIAPVGKFQAVELRGYLPKAVLATAVVWERLSSYERFKVLQRLAKEHGPQLAEALDEGTELVQAFLTACDRENLEPNLEKLQESWARGTLNLEALSDSLAKSLESLRANVRRQAVAATINSQVSLTDYPETFPAVNRQRKLIAVLGPTNSGKTYDAFHRLATAKSGVYLGPLRLLALEAYTRLNTEFGIKASLITGEERREVPGSQVTASTIEMLNTSREIEVAVIDEIQMLEDPDRGWAWTQAVVGVNADEVWLLGALSAEPAIRALAERLGLPLEVRTKERKNPLVVDRNALAPNPRAALQQAAEGDAFIVFSRRDALNLRDDLIQLGKSVACIYGALSPEVREREAQRFATGEAQVLVATDAIGLGLNLPLKRVIFTCVKKYDGIDRVELPTALLQQIAGRAGRYGLQQEEGIVCGLTQNEHRVVQKLMKERQKNLDTRGFQIGASSAYLAKIAQMTNESRLEILLTLFVRYADRGDGFFRPYVPQEQIERAAQLDALPGLSLELKHIFAQAPMASNHEVLDSTWRAWGRAASQGKKVRLQLKQHPASASLEEAETAVRILAGYRWFAYRLPEIFVDYEVAEAELEPWVGAVDAHLRSRRRQGAGGGKSGVPSWYWAS